MCLDRTKPVSADEMNWISSDGEEEVLGGDDIETKCAENLIPFLMGIERYGEIN